MRLSFHIRVQREVDEAVAWYDEQRAGLGDEFFAKLSTSLQQIAEHPEGFGFWLGSTKIRRASLKKFPYDVLFEVKTDRVRIVCVRHRKRHPSFGMGRK
jgi:toxin ParE1/3/4